MTALKKVKRRRLLVGWLILLASVLAGVAWTMVRVRGQVIELYSSSEERDAWREWRAAATKLTDEGGPVQRRPPRADEPPALILMRDHFASCLAGALVMSAVLFGALAFLVQGMLSSDSGPLPATGEAPQKP